MHFCSFRFKTPLLIIVMLAVSGCGSLPKPVRNLGKSDVDFVMDTHARQLKIHIAELTRKLYVRNPIQLSKNQHATIESRIKQILGPKDQIELPPLVFDELNGLTSIDAILLSFEQDYEGDRVFAAMVGLTEMLRRSYDHQQEFFIVDSLDEQTLYNSARNIEIFVWRLYHRRDALGNPLIFTNDTDEQGGDFSFDRLFTKMITIQDMMALIVADKTNRSITKVAHGVAQFVFLPIP